jgi:hypothetical protein
MTGGAPWIMDVSDLAQMIPRPFAYITILQGYKQLSGPTHTAVEMLADIMIII